MPNPGDYKPDAVFESRRKRVRRLFDIPEGLECETPECRNLAVHRHHIDGDNDNNRRSNVLRICVACHHMFHWGVRIGENNGMSKLNWDVVGEIRTRYAQGGVTYADLAVDYGVGARAIGKVVRGERWTSDVQPPRNAVTAYVGRRRSQPSTGDVIDLDDKRERDDG